MRRTISLKASVAVLFIAFAHDAWAAEIGGVSYAADTPCPSGCASSDGKRLQAAFESPFTRPHQRQKMLQIINENTADGKTNWPAAARLYFAWRESDESNKPYSPPPASTPATAKIDYPKTVQVSRDVVDVPCPSGCASSDGKRLQAAFESPFTRPHQRQKMLQIINENTADGKTNWPAAARLYFAWRESDESNKPYSPPPAVQRVSQTNSYSAAPSAPINRKWQQPNPAPAPSPLISYRELSKSQLCGGIKKARKQNSPNLTYLLGELQNRGQTEKVCKSSFWKYVLGAAIIAGAVAAASSGGGGGSNYSSPANDYIWSWDAFRNEYGVTMWRCRGHQTGEFADDWRCAGKMKTDTTWPG